MKLEITRNNEVGKADHGWLRAKHYFSFASYYNPNRMGFGKLRVINDDIVEPGQGFGTHPHRDMEIITIPQAGAVSHEDSGGNKGTIRKGEVQVMSAGKGVLHSEFNHADDEQLNLFQIWIEPNEFGVEPRYGQEQFNFQDTKNAWTLLVSPIRLPEEKGLKIHQDAYISVTLLEQGQTLKYELKKPGHGVYLLVVDGEIQLAGETLTKRDAVGVSDTSEVLIRANLNTEVLAIEVPLTQQ